MVKKEVMTEEKILKWIMDVTGEKVKDPDSIFDSLRDGIMLCKLVNTIRPGAIPRINTKPVKYLQIENISLFIRICKRVGCPQHDVMSAVDLFDGSNIRQVMTCIESFGRQIQKQVAEGKLDYDGPTLGAKLAKKRDSEECYNFVWDLKNGEESQQQDSQMYTVKDEDGNEMKVSGEEYKKRQDEKFRLAKEKLDREKELIEMERERLKVEQEMDEKRLQERKAELRGDVPKKKGKKKKAKVYEDDDLFRFEEEKGNNGGLELSCCLIQ